MSILSKLNKSIKKTLKNKKTDVNQKYEEISNIYYDFFGKQFHSLVNLSTYENHYEYFMRTDFDGEPFKLQKEYEESYELEKENRLYVDCVTLSQLTKTCLKNGLDSSKLSKKSKFMFDRISKIDSACGFDKTFDYERFYLDKRMRFDISKETKKFYDDIFDEYIKVQQSENTLENNL